MLSDLEMWLLLYWPERYERCQPDENHAYRRLFTKAYKAKKQIVKGLWIATGLLMIAYPLLPFMVTLGLFTTFLSFSILDESA
ncbi:MAG: hypothetical protein V7739_02865 [Motiliproteus sp.]